MFARLEIRAAPGAREQLHERATWHERSFMGAAWDTMSCQIPLGDCVLSSIHLIHDFCRRIDPVR
jgi:hypothetical protein